VTFEENIDPPYILFNNTPFPLKIRRIEPTSDGEAVLLNQNEAYSATAGAALQVRTF